MIQMITGGYYQILRVMERNKVRREQSWNLPRKEKETPKPENWEPVENPKEPVLTGKLVKKSRRGRLMNTVV